MNTSWTYKIDSGDFDKRGEPIRYVFTYVLETDTTNVEMATNQYEWEGEREAEASGILLEPVMPIAHEMFLASEYQAWVSICQFWAHKN